MSVKKPARICALVTLAVVLAMAIGSSSASAAPCPTNILCDGAENPIRSDFTGAPALKGYGGDLLATNSESTLRLLALEGEEPVFANSNPANYAYFGIELMTNPPTSKTTCNDAEGWVTFADIQNAEPSPVYAGISPTRFGPWPVVVFSNALNEEEPPKPVCGENAGKVFIEDTHLLFSNIGGGNTAIASGTFVGDYVQPEEGCEGGGVELAGPQPGITVTALGQNFSGAIDNGAGGNALICFVSSNNALYPTEAPTWGPFSDEEGSPVPGIWKD